MWQLNLVPRGHPSLIPCGKETNTRPQGIREVRPYTTPTYFFRCLFSSRDEFNWEGATALYLEIEQRNSCNDCVLYC